MLQCNLICLTLAVFRTFVPPHSDPILGWSPPHRVRGTIASHDLPASSLWDLENHRGFICSYYISYFMAVFTLTIYLF